MGVKVDVIAGLYNRLNTYTTAGSALDFIENISVGMTDELRTDISYPILEIQLASGQELNAYNHGGKVDEMGFIIRYIENKLAYDDNNTLYNEDYELGLIYRLETILNCIENDPTTGEMDLSFSSVDVRQLTMRYTIEYRDKIIVSINLNLQSQMFQAGQR